VIASARACLTPMFDDKPCTVMPVFSSGQSARQAPGTYGGLKSTDLIVTAGGGIIAHPDGPGAGVKALRVAWDATIAGIPLVEASKTCSELRRALEMAQ
jgi:ribulose-bisphosphate carboxylase large chain